MLQSIYWCLNQKNIPGSMATTRPPIDVWGSTYMRHMGRRLYRNSLNSEIYISPRYIYIPTVYIYISPQYIYIPTVYIYPHGIYIYIPTLYIYIPTVYIYPHGIYIYIPTVYIYIPTVYIYPHGIYIYPHGIYISPRYLYIPTVGRLQSLDWTHWTGLVDWTDIALHKSMQRPFTACAHAHDCVKIT